MAMVQYHVVSLHSALTRPCETMHSAAKVLGESTESGMQTGLPVPYILEPYRTVPSICEPNRLSARNFRARAEPNRMENVRYGTTLLPER
jgi:hypothetical protein